MIKQFQFSIQFPQGAGVEETMEEVRHESLNWKSFHIVLPDSKLCIYSTAYHNIEYVVWRFSEYREIRSELTATLRVHV